jgi:hypothetical protein
VLPSSSNKQTALADMRTIIWRMGRAISVMLQAAARLLHDLASP